MAKRKIRERWRVIPGHTGYQVSDWGRVRSLDRWVQQRHASGVLYERFFRGKMLAPVVGRRDGYRSVKLESPRRTTPVYLLVLLAFRGPPPKGKEACHNNGKSLDDRLSNLRYDTHRNNLLDRIKHSLLRLR